MKTTITSRVVIRGNLADRRAVLLRGSLADLARLERAEAEGWDVAADLASARASVAAFSGPVTA